MSLMRTDNIQINPYVFFPAVVVIVLFVLFGGIFTETAGIVFESVQTFIVTNLGWFYILSVAFFLVFVIVMFLGPYGNIRLGPDDSEPEYTYGSWFAMLFSAGMGIGLVFFSVAEPIFHFMAPPMAEPGSYEAAKESMLFTFFHWGFHAWAIYIIVGLSLAYFSYRKGLPLSIRSAFFPILGRKIAGAPGNIIDIFAIFGTMFGVATSLGIGVMQVNAGLDYLFGIAISTTAQITLITVITLIATVSVFLGLEKGIKRLSNTNMVMALILIIFVFAFGPTLYIVNSMVENTGYYLQNLIEITFWMDAVNDTGWQNSWTLFYWGWWISWSPFVGMFIARISKGRTIREFIGGVLFVPTILTFIWLTIFGNTALHIEIFGEGGIAGVQTEQMLFQMLEGFPLSSLTSIIAVFVIILFFVTSSDSGSLVIDMLASGGNPDPPKWQRVFWALSEGAVAAVLLLAGGLAALQTAAIATGLPFAVVLIFMCYSLVKSLRKEKTDSERVVKRFPAKGKSRGI